MFSVAVTIKGYKKEINYPKICPRNPEHQSAFCHTHCSVVKKKGIPTDIKQFFLQDCRNKGIGMKLHVCICVLVVNFTVCSLRIE